MAPFVTLVTLLVLAATLSTVMMQQAMPDSRQPPLANDDSEEGSELTFNDLCASTKCPVPTCKAILTRSENPVSKIPIYSCECPQSCSDRPCHLPNGTSIPHLTEWINTFDPCQTFICNNGGISLHSAVCAALSCPRHHQISVPGMCCDICDRSKSQFCDDEENRDCDIECRYKHVRDPVRHCDLCRCSRDPTFTVPQVTVNTTSDIYDETKTFFYFTRDGTTSVQFLWILGIAVTVSILFLITVIWLLHVRRYKRVPLINSSTCSMASSQDAQYA